MTQTVLLGDVIKKGEITIHNKLRAPLNSRQRTEMQGSFPYYGATGQMDSIDRYKFDGFFVLVAEDGTVYGSNGICPMIQRVRGKFWVSNHAHVLQGDDEIDTKYLALALEAVDVRPNITGAVQLKLSKDNLFKIKIYWPNRRKRETILDLVDPIDEKIELNRKMNETLEQMGQALFRHYFIDNPKAEKWEDGVLGDIIINFDSKRKPLSSRQRAEMSGGYRYFGATSVMDHVNDYLFDGTYLLLAEDGSVIKTDGTPYLQYIWGKFWVNNHAHILQAKAPFTVEYLYLLLSQANIQSLISGAVQLKINQKAMNSFKIKMPPNELVKEFCERIDPMFAQRRKNEDEIQTLTTLRDTLLPRLINGKVKV